MSFDDSLTDAEKGGTVAKLLGWTPPSRRETAMISFPNFQQLYDIHEWNAFSDMFCDGELEVLYVKLRLRKYMLFSTGIKHELLYRALQNEIRTK
jgi:hypothetical protein